MAAHRRVAQHFRVVAAQCPGDADPVIAIGTGEFPLVAGREVTVGEAIVIAQIVGMLWRAALRQISGRRANRATRGRDLARNQRR